MEHVATRFGLDPFNEEELSTQDRKLINILSKVSVDLVPDQTLSNRQQEIFVSIADGMNVSEDIFAIYPFNNISDNAEDGTLDGYVCVLHPNAPARVDYLADDFLQCTAIAKIKNAKGGVTQKNLASLGEKLNSVVPVFSDNPCSLKHRDSITGLDKSVWKPELGPSGEAGIYKSSSDWEPEYYVVVRASIPVVSKELMDMMQSEDFTISEFYDKPEFSWAKEAARRNTLQLMYNISSALGLRLGDENCNKTQRDYTSATSKTTSHALMSVAEHLQYNNTIEKVSLNGNTAYGVFKDVVPSSSCENQLIVYSGCKGGLKRFDTLAKTDAVIGYPATTTKKSDPNDSKTSHSSIGIYGKFFVWEGKNGVEDVNNSLLHSDFYGEVDENFQDMLGLLGMKASHPTQELRAVCVKIRSKNQTRFDE